MKSPNPSQLILLSLLASSVSAQLVFPNVLRQRKPIDRTQGHEQEPILNLPHVGMPASGDGDSGSTPGDPVMISDVIGKERGINIFAGFTRDIESISNRLDHGTENTTVLAPLNSVVTQLPRKPWEDPKDYAALGENAYEGSKGEDRAHRNLRRFVEAHVVPVSPWKENDKVKTLDGGEIWYETKDGKKIIQPGNIEVDSVANRVANGELWVLKGIINYSQ
ncbi:MAG: Transcriptional regulatory protein sin3 [Chaenotheca gracillima]|nr:MAG: Transcriptional regulatory protein sin3 [Chaenotheca gracillima]